MERWIKGYGFERVNPCNFRNWVARRKWSSVPISCCMFSNAILSSLHCCCLKLVYCPYQLYIGTNKLHTIVLQQSVSLCDLYPIYYSIACTTWYTHQLLKISNKGWVLLITSLRSLVIIWGCHNLYICVFTSVIWLWDFPRDNTGEYRIRCEYLTGWLCW